MYNIVILVGSYYPNYSAVGRCMGNIAEELIALGHKVTVISLFTKLNQGIYEKYNGQNIIRIKTKAIEDIIITNGSDKTFLKIVHKSLRVLKSITAPNSLNEELTEKYCEALFNLKETPSIILPTCLPYETIESAIRYKNNNKSCRVFPILFDLFAINGRLQYFNWNMKIKEMNNRVLEERMLEYSDRVLGLTTWKSYINSFFPQYLGKFVEIEHPLLVNTNNWSRSTDYLQKSAINFVYAGIVDKAIRNPKKIIDFFTKLNESFKAVLHFYTRGNAQFIVDKAAKDKEYIIKHDFVPTNVAHSVMKGADVLVSIGNMNTKQSPSKIFEYISTGKPIVHFVISETDAVIDLLKRYPNSCCIFCNNESTREVKKLINFLKIHQNTELKYDSIIKLFPEASPSFVVKQIGF